MNAKVLNFPNLKKEIKKRQSKTKLKSKFNRRPYFVLSNEAGRFMRRGDINELPENIIELLENGYHCSVWDIQGNDPDILVSENYGHPSFAFTQFEELTLGDFV